MIEIAPLRSSTDANACADVQSAKARKARELGVRVIAESAFWPLIGVDVN
jgi:hypothetical protein